MSRVVIGMVLKIGDEIVITDDSILGCMVPRRGDLFSWNTKYHHQRDYRGRVSDVEWQPWKAPRESDGVVVITLSTDPVP